jgi:hypothetical protein
LARTTWQGIDYDGTRMKTTTPIAAGGHSHHLVGLIVVGVIWTVIGAVNVASPSFWYRMSRWQYRNPDAMAPSARALLVTRFVGAASVVGGIVLIVVGATH